MRGRKPKPTHLRLITGNAGKRRINKHEPKPSGHLTEPPDWFTPAQIETWRHAIANAPAGLLRKLDRGVLTVWTVAATLHQEAASKLNDSSLLVRGPARQADLFGGEPVPRGAPVPNPFLSILHKQANIMMRAAEQLGFSPASRARVEISTPDEDDGDQFFQE